MSRTIYIKLTPKAASDRIGDTRLLPDGKEQLMVYVTAVPENGKANLALIRLLARHFGIAASRFQILQGQTSRHKIVEILE